MKLLKEGERLSSEELEREEILARLFKYFSEFLQKSKEEKIQDELKSLIDYKKEEFLISYFKQILVVLRKIRFILHYMSKSNEGILAKNAQRGIMVKVESEYKTLADRHIPEFNNPEVFIRMINFVREFLS